jgi:catechol 2,3-dioxygenase-like lactoylglutathione lyase family enzyme/ribosomal protein S18 acetylase RimI-like enzyme
MPPILEPMTQRADETHESVAVRTLTRSDRGWLAKAVRATWGSIRVVSRGRLIEDVTRLPGFVAKAPNGNPIGFALLRFEGDDAEVVVLQSLEQGRGAGTALLEAARADAHDAGWRRVWLVTTNDNLHALRFYQRRGWDWIAMHRDAVVESRRLKPEISPLGAHDIPIRHELEFELALDLRPSEVRHQPLRHLALAVHDQDRSRRFYATYFGFDSVQRCPDGTLMLRNRDGFLLALGPAHETPTMPALFHFGFELPDPQSVDALRARLVADGIPVVQEWRQPDYVSVKCRDPDGYVVEAAWQTPQRI